MLTDLIEQEAKFAPFLREGDYTFIGPEVNSPLFENFIKTVNMRAPVKRMSRSIHDALSHQDSVRYVLKLLPENAPLRIFVVVSPDVAGDALFHSTIEEYCDRFDIEYNPE